MKRRRLLLATLLCVVCALFGLVAVACNSSNTFSVTFDVQGHGTAPAQLLDVESGSTVEEPTAPVAEGYTFGGWYKETTCENKWDFATDTVEADTTLYASWEANSYTLTYNVQGHGTAPEAVSVKYNSKVEAPTAPTAEGYKFGGWYKEAACTNEWNFETDVVTGNVTLYANWLYTVTFDAQGHGTAPAQVTDVANGAKVEEPAPLSESGYVFEGWYKEAACENEWFFDTDSVTDNVTLYAYWKQIYNVSLSDGATFSVTDHSYVNIPVDGMYSFSVATPSASEQENGVELEYEIDSTTVQKQTNRLIYLVKGRHTVTSLGSEFDVAVVIDSIDTPFNEVCTYAGETHQLTVSGLGIYDNEKTGPVTFRIDNKFASVYDYADGYYIVEANRVSYRLKINLTNGTVVSVELYEYDSANQDWAETPDTLVKLLNASDVLVDLTATAEGVTVNEDVEETFEYVYFDASSLKDKWVEFSDFAEGTEFHWFDLNSGRTGSILATISVTDGVPVLLQNTYSACIGVKPASGTAVSFKVKLVEAPKGLSVDNPIEITEKQTVMENVLSGSQYYFTYDLANAGDYVICVSNTPSWGGTSYTMYYTVNGVAYGYDSLSWSWIKISNDNPYAEVSLVSGVNSIVVTVGSWDNNFTISIEPVPVYNVTTGDYQGSFDGSTYFFEVDAENNTVSLTLTVDGDDYVLAESAALTESNGVYSFATVAVENVAAAGTVTFTVDKSGSLKVTAPEEFTAAPYVAASPLVEGTYKYVDDALTYTLAVTGNDVDGYKASFKCTYEGVDDFNAVNKSVVDNKFTFFNDYNLTEYEVTITMNANGSLHVVYDGFMSGNYADFTLVGSVSNDPVELIEGTYKGTDENGGSFILVITQYRGRFVVDYTIDGDLYGEGLALIYNEDSDTYSFEYEPWEGSTYTVTFTVTADANGNPQLNVDDEGLEFTATLGGEDEDTLPFKSGVYFGGATEDYENYTYYYIEVDAENSTVTYTRDETVLAEDVSLKFVGTMYAFDYVEDGVTKTVTFTVGDFYGTTMFVVSDGSVNYNATYQGR